jgi:putative peptide zinc metalloprotease protein
MLPADDTYGTAATRRLGARLRPDLDIHARTYGSDLYYLVQDRASGRYFFLGKEEHSILTMLDGDSSLQAIKSRFEAAHAPLRLTLEQLQSFLSHLFDLGLLIVDAPGQGDELLRRHRRRLRLERWEAIGNVLAIRLPGVDPQPLLRRLHDRFAWLFAWWFLAACFGLIISAMTLAAVQFDTLVRRLSDSPAFFTPANLLWLALAVAIAKILHELGHALTCVHFGGECHEMGVLLLVFTPCLYCDVSDVWLMPGKWRRIAVSAAGIFVEIVLASVCLLLWWYSEPGRFNTLMLNMVIACSVSTLFLNGNPLLRYDGYYVLSDWLEVPNLSQQARTLVNRGIQRIVFGLERPPSRYVRERLRRLVAVYGVASLVYRWCVAAAILWACYRFLEPRGLQFLAEALAVIVIGGMIVMPLVRAAASFSNPLFRRQLRARQLLRGSLIWAAAGAVLLLTPLPFRVSAPVVLELRDGRDIFAAVPGRLVRTASAGQRVTGNQEIARLENSTIAREIVELAGQREQQRVRLRNLSVRLADDPSLAPQIPAAEEALADIEARTRQRQNDAEQLVLRAPVAGIVVPAPWQPGRASERGTLNTWQGTLLEPRNLGAWVETGTLLCSVGNPARLEGILVVDQADIRFVQRGQHVRLKLDQMPGIVLRGTIVAISKLDMKAVPRELAASGSLPVRIDRTGVSHPATAAYQARVALDHVPPEVLVAARGQAKVFAAPQSLAARLWRRTLQVFRLGS